ncbi:MAG: thiamine phosphate synthase [Candidatus Omnitrophica bacterium]|nr:thiamine phosphate synthase [Candidatus Omnitrophota bacterium]
MKNKNLYLVLSSEYNQKKNVLAIAEQAIFGGVDIIQMREKHLSDAEKIKLGKKLYALCQTHKVMFIVNDDPYLAQQLNADGVHLGQTDLEKYPLIKARQIIGQNKIIGLSTHNIEQFKQALNQGYDYLAYGPIFETKTKDYHIGTSQISQVLAWANLPVVFIGGINLRNIDLVLEKGAQNIALIRAIMQAENITQTVKEFKQKILRGKMQLRINGKPQEIKDNFTLETLISDKGLNPSSIVVEYNAQIMPKQKWAEVILKQGDIIEIISFVGGG